MSEEERSSYEAEVATSIYSRWEKHIAGWETFQEVVLDLTQRHHSRDLVWRGVRVAEWGVMSSLYRALLDRRGQAPTETEMISAEKEILAISRKDWRFDHMPAMELLAHLQHYGAPTRLLDVTINPLIALWFAVEESNGWQDGQDGRVFAFVTTDRPISLNERWGGRYPRWHEWSDGRRRSELWGTGKRRRLWRPPAYNERISAQNAGFLIDGVPIETGFDAGSRIQAPVEQLRVVSSMHLRFARVEREDFRPEAAPVFTLRIEAGAKAQIRDQLERRFGYRASSIYPDMSGLAAYLDSRWH